MVNGKYGKSLYYRNYLSKVIFITFSLHENNSNRITYRAINEITRYIRYVTTQVPK